MKYVSLFAGIGGFDLALNRLGHECVYTNEWDKYAAQIYEKNFNHTVDTRSITDVSAESIPDHDLLVGGFPCQAFSIAGKRRGFDETRGTLFFDIARILKEKHTRYCVLENVKGLLSHDNGRTIKVILTTLTELGYDVQWQVLNSRNHGVPQNRERIFIIGHLRGEPRPQVFPIPGNNSTTLKELTSNQSQGGRVYDTTGISTTIASQAGGLGAKTGLYFIDMSMQEAKVTNQSRTLTARYYKGWSNHTAANSGIYDQGTIRRLTPVECERLQGFPDDWTAGVSDTQRYKCLGNAVTVNVVQAIMERFNV